MKAILVGFFCLFLGSTIGAGVSVFIYSEGYSYLLKDSKACLNCHAMNDAHYRWSKSSHRHVANCNDCHSAGNVIEKYWGKARSGFLHSYSFTVGDYEPIRIRDFNKVVVEKACRNCHGEFLKGSHFSIGQKTSCVSCHSEVGHLWK